MDTLTHGLAGALLAQALPAADDDAGGARLRARAAWTGFLTAMAPDADALLSPFSTEFYLRHHRGLSHSFVLLPAWAALFGALALWRLPAGVPRRAAATRLVLVSALGVASHIVLDWITSFGTMFLSPLSWRRFSLDWVFILDLVLSGLLAAGLVAAWGLARPGRERRGRFAARAGVIASAAWIAFCGVRHAQALEVARRLAPAGMRDVAAIPQPLSPARWLLLAQDEREVSVAFADLSRRAPDRPAAESARALERIAASRGPGAILKDLPFLYRSPDDPLRLSVPRSRGERSARALAAREASLFGWFARYPAAFEEPLPGGRTRVLLRDLRFGYLSAGVDRFTWVAEYDANGGLVSAGFPSSRFLSGARAATAAP